MFMDMRNFKFKALQAYCLNELVLAEKAEYQSECLEEQDRDKSDEVLRGIALKIRENGNTVENIEKLAASFAPIATYYNIIIKTVGRHFTVGEKYIPAFLILSILQEYTLRGHKGFDDVDFIETLSMYEKPDNDVRKHYECAFDIVTQLEKIKGIRKAIKNKKKAKR